MSVVVGLAHGGKVWLGGDSAASDPRDGLTVTYKGPKVFRRGKLLIGCVESFRMRDLLEHQFEVPRYRKGQDDEEYIFKHVLEQVRSTLTTGGYELEDELEENELAPSGAILIGFHGRLFAVDWDYHIGEVREPYLAIGAGAPFALGSLHVTSELTHKYSARLRVLNALRVAAHYCSGVRAPFRIISGK